MPDGSGTAPAAARWARLFEPRDAASLAAFRFLFGLLMFVSTVRFMANGWVEQLFLEPELHFKYWGFEWVRVLPPEGMYAAFAVLAVAALCIALGLAYRVATVVFFVLFAYVELLDVTTYLNHYYLVTLLSLLLCFLPLHRYGSLDAWLRPGLRRATLPAWVTYLLRFQVGVVYVYAGLAKLGSDWLVHGQPLNIWLSARSDLPIVGAWLAEPWMAVAMSWGGFLNDTLVVAFLMWRRSRPWAYAVVVGFHLATHLLFPIGVFPFLMILSAMVFFDPSWPRRLLQWLPATRRHGRLPERREGSIALPGVWPRRLGATAIGLYCAYQILMPLRTHVYGGNVLWHEQGMRFSWRVMVREKNGSVTFRVKTAERERERIVSPSRYLTRLQRSKMARKPELILQLAHHIERDMRRRGHRDVEVRVDALASLNGRPAQRFIDPDVDLTRVHDGLARADWVLPGPEVPPLRLHPPSSQRMRARSGGQERAE